MSNLPALKDIVALSEDVFKGNALMVLINQPPPDKWLKPHPTATRKNEEGKYVPIKYLPREYVEFLLSSIFTKYWVELRSDKLVANSYVVTVRLYVIDPIDGETRWNDGIGAVACQTDKGAGATDFNKIKSNAIQLAAPAAETFAIKDAAEKFGKIFGRDLNVDPVSYTGLLKEQIDIEELKELYELKKEGLTEDEIIYCGRIINGEEKNSYSKLHKFLMDK